MEIDLSALEPLAATPHSPGNIAKVREIAGTPVDQVCVGSCTNSSYSDLMTVAKMLEGKRLHPNVSLVVAPASRQVMEMIAASGGLAALVAAGARINECACGFCIGIGQAPRTNAVSLRTSNRNFLGRSGTQSANVYLVSPQVAAAAAITGVITDPRDLGSAPPAIRLPKKFRVDDAMILQPPADRSKVEIYRGAGIGLPPVAEPLKERIAGEVAIKVGDKVTTDHIIPAGSRMKYRSNVAEVLRVRVRERGRDFRRPRGREQEERRGQRHRRGPELRAGLQPRARGLVPDAPRRPDGRRQVRSSASTGPTSSTSASSPRRSPTRRTTTAFNRATASRSPTCARGSPPERTSNWRFPGRT